MNNILQVWGPHYMKENVNGGTFWFDIFKDRLQGDRAVVFGDGTDVNEVVFKKYHLYWRDDHSDTLTLKLSDGYLDLNPHAWAFGQN